MVFYNWILLTLLFLLSTFLYFVGFFLPCTICVHNHFFVKRHYFYATIVFCWIQPFEVFLKGLGSYNLSRMLRGAVLWSWHSEPEERTPKGCCWNLCGGREYSWEHGRRPAAGKGPLSLTSSLPLGRIRVRQNTLWQGSVGRSLPPGSQRREGSIRSWGGHVTYWHSAWRWKVCRFASCSQPALLSYESTFPSNYWCPKFPSISWLFKKITFLLLRGPSLAIPLYSFVATLTWDWAAQTLRVSSFSDTHTQLVPVLRHFSRVWLFVILKTVICLPPSGGSGLAGESMGFSRQEYWNEFPFPSPGDLPNPGIEPVSLTSPALAGEFFTISKAYSHQLTHKIMGIISFIRWTSDF